MRPSFEDAYLANGEWSAVMLPHNTKKACSMIRQTRDHAGSQLPDHACPLIGVDLSPRPTLLVPVGHLVKGTSITCTLDPLLWWERRLGSPNSIYTVTSQAPERHDRDMLMRVRRLTLPTNHVLLFLENNPPILVCRQPSPCSHIPFYPPTIAT